MPESVLDMLREVNPNAVPAEQPPSAANYREADVDGISCAGCAKFVYTGGEAADGVPAGYCSQWEAYVRGDFVSDAFADGGPPLDDNGNEIWDFADDEKTFNEIHLAGTDTVEESGFVVKEVLRTGEWPVIPTRGGLMRKPLRVVRDGVSDSKEGVIALAELVANFEAGAIANPQVPLSDDESDHKNITRVNTGFVRGLWIEDKDDGAVLKAKLEFTEPEVKEKVLRGTYADVSCGIPWKIRSRGKEFGATVEHVAITNRPFIDGLGPFLAASEQQREEAEVVSYREGDPAPEDERPEVALTNLSFGEIRDQIHSRELGAHGLEAGAYRVLDLKGNQVRIGHRISGVVWAAEITISDDDQVSLSAPGEWKVEDGETIEPSAERGSPSGPELSELDQARRLREIRLSQPSATTRAKESNMPLSREELDALELSDDARAALQSVLDENARLTAQTREAAADRRVEELKALGLADRPGALKFYRQVYLSDDGGPAVVLSDANGAEKPQLSALEILDRFIEGVKGSDGKVTLSDQALASGNDDPPPATSETETEKPVEERLAEARQSLYGKK